MISPEFASIAETDPEMAKACSQALTEEYAFIQKSEDAERYGAGAAFVRNPDNRLIGVQALYFDSTYGPHAPAAISLSNFENDLIPTQEMAKEYRSSVGYYQEFATDPTVLTVLTAIPRFAGQYVHEWFVEKAREDDRKLLVAHIQGRPGGSEDLTSVTAYPRKIRQELDTFVHDVFVGDLPKLPENSQAAFQEHVIGNPAVSDLIGNVVVCSQLLTMRDFTTYISQYRAFQERLSRGE